MKWNRVVVDDRYHDFSQYFSVIFIIFSFLLEYYTALTVFAVCFIYFRFHHYYFKQVGRKLRFKNTIQRTRLNVEDQEKWKLEFENKGLPIFGAHLKITFSNIVEPIGLQYVVDHHDKVEVAFPFQLGRNEIGSFTIPIEGKRRGLCRISKMELEIPHLFGNGKLNLTLAQPVHSTILVFPKAKPVVIGNETRALGDGDLPIQTSLYQNRFQPVGTRDYIYGDQFKDIHWKASARMQTLQTKVFAPSTKKEWLISLNLTEHYSITRRLEDLTKEVAYLIHKAVKDDIHFSLVINIRSQGVFPFYYLAAGNGVSQGQTALEVLSTLSTDDTTVPYSIVLQQLHIQKLLPPTMIHGGSTTQDVERLMQRISFDGVEVLMIQDGEEKGALLPWKQIS
ncbi:DUF58 domain-containing protein [Rossellomorea sp. BNER]|uniref:DUF58 domain-containing protein n=1 Tax=Rossellomorea sp. BNER TaxID=2962031 RepID=UPI003AF25C93|nr:DUF58 domain-containing protein [Rossellomorea sp. BNER]